MAYYCSKFTRILPLLFFLAFLSLLIVPVSAQLQNDSDFEALKHRETPQCRAVRSIKAHKQCGYATRYCADEDDGILSYFSLFYCRLAAAKPLAVIILVLWLVFLFAVLGMTAGDYLAINLGSIAQALNMSDTFAGVTFLALGNGAPDVFSTIAAMNNSSDSLAIGELLGAAAFITGVIPGSMALIRSFDVVKVSLIRDAAFLFATVAFLTYVMSDGYLRLWHCLVLLGTYIIYIITVMSWHWWRSHRSQKDKHLGTDNHEHGQGHETDPLLQEASLPADISSGRNANTRSTKAPQKQSLWDRALYEMIPAYSEKCNYRFLRILAQVIMLPASLALELTIPRVEEKLAADNSETAIGRRRRGSSASLHALTGSPWGRWPTVIQCFTAPQIVIWVVTKQLSRDPSENFVPCMIALGVSIVLAALVILTTSTDLEPPWHRFLCIPGFIVSIAWISMLADEIVAVLKILGIISNIPDAIIGITVFAFGNSIDDWAANISVARHEHPVMALSACFGGPLFNILLGLSVSGIMVILRGMKAGSNNVAISLNPSRSLFIVAGTAMASIGLLLLLMPMTQWKMTRLVGYLLTGLWVTCTVVNVALEATL